MKIQSTLFKAYLFLLPFMALPGLAQLKKAIGPQLPITNNLVLLMLGLGLFILLRRGRFLWPKKALVTQGVTLCFLLNIISFCTSLILFIPFGPLNGENTLRASFPSVVFMFLTAAAFYYNAMMFKTIQKREIEKVFDVLAVILLAIGLLQLAVLKILGMSGVYNLINFSGILVDSTFLQKMGRICFTGSEPASSGSIINVFILPYVLSKILTTNYLKYKIYTLLFVFLLFFTFSSTAYTGLVVNIMVFGYWYIKKRVTTKLVSQVLAGCSLIGLILLFAGPYLWNNTSVGHSIEELLFKKTTSQENISTIVRYSSVRADLKAFLHYPLTGVGNGNQGYFYNSAVQAMSAQALQYGELADKLDGNMGIVNGGAFVPAFLSGYGVIGVILLFIFLRKCVIYIRHNPQEYGIFQYMYYIGGITFLALGTVSSGLDGNFIALFISSIPFMQSIQRSSTL